MQNRYYWVYILLCSNLNYYTGYTIDIGKRYEAHKNGTSKCKYTRSFPPIKLAQCWRIEGDKSLAMQIECYIKRLSRSEKEQLIANPILLAQYYPVLPEEVL